MVPGCENNLKFYSRGSSQLHPFRFIFRDPIFTIWPKNRPSFHSPPPTLQTPWVSPSKSVH